MRAESPWQDRNAAQCPVLATGHFHSRKNYTSPVQIIAFLTDYVDGLGKVFVLH